MAHVITAALKPDPPEDFRVLIVDDYEDIRTMLAMMLKMRGFQVLQASNGQEGVEMACHEQPDLILMDLNMPVMNGFEATRQLKHINLTKTIPILAISANCSNANDHQEALEAGCIDCLSKPVQWERIQALLNTF